MKRHIPGLHSRQQDGESLLEGLFLVRVDCALLPLASAETIPDPCASSFSNRNRSLRADLFSGRLYCTERALWKLNWFLRDFGYDSRSAAPGSSG